MQSSSGWATIALVCAQDQRFSTYTAEIMRHCGFIFTEYAIDQIDEACASSRILILAGDASLDYAEGQSIRELVSEGGTLICLGSTSGLDELLGVRTVQTECGEGYVAPCVEHPMLEGDPFPIHFFGGHGAEAAGAMSLADLLDPHQRSTGFTGFSLNETGGGLAVFFAPNLGVTALRMRQGRYVDFDAVPMNDCDLQDAILRSEDAFVLDWYLDRSKDNAADPAGFLHPQFDRLWGLLLRTILYVAQRQNQALPLLWFHPRNSAGAGMISFNTDGKDPQNAVSILHQANLVGLRGTWCVQQPGYHSDLYRVLRNRNNEVATMFDSGDDHWTKDQLKIQSTNMARVSGAKHMASIKPADGRWRGRNGFYEWCVDLNLTVEIGRGPFHDGNTGFLFGTCHPFRPMRNDGGTYGVTSIPFLIHNPGLNATSARCLSLIDRVAKYHGVVHFSIDTEEFEQKAVSEAFRNIVVHARANGMEWMTAEDVGAFHRSRRLVRGSLSNYPDGLGVTLNGELDLAGATVLVLGPPVVGAKANDRRMKPQTVHRYGYAFSSVVIDLLAKRPVELLFERRASERVA